MDVIQYLICWPLGRSAKLRSQNRNSCKFCAYFRSWLVLSLADAILLFTPKLVEFLKIALCYFIIK